MDLIDVDPEMMHRHAEAVAHAYEQSIVHVEAEIKGVIPELMETLTPHGPYGYTILPEVQPDGGVRLPILSTREEIEGAYKMIRGASALLSVIPLTEIRGTWYTFQDNISRGELKSTGDRGAHRTLALFPSGKGTGITGELVWIQVPPSVLGGGPAPEPSAEEMFRRESVYLQHERYLESLRVGDREGVLATLHNRVASAVRDYVRDTGTLTTLEGKGDHDAYYQAFFRRYDITDVEVLDRVAEDWYVFAELRLTASIREGEAAGRSVTFHTAEFHIPANDGRFIARIGHGTDLA